MDILRYPELKAKGLARLERKGDEVKLITEKWDDHTGEKKEPEEENVEFYATELEMLLTDKAYNQKRIDVLVELVADMDELKEKKK